MLRQGLPAAGQGLLDRTAPWPSDDMVDPVPLLGDREDIERRSMTSNTDEKEFLACMRQNAEFVFSPPSLISFEHPPLLLLLLLPALWVLGARLTFSASE